MADSKKYDGSQWEHSLRKLGTATETIQSGDTIYANGQPITTYTLKGNEEHTGTPSPQNPVMPNGVGVRTENLFDYSDLENGSINTTNGSNVDNPTQQRTKSYMSVIGGESYCISNLPSWGNVRVHQYKQDKTYLGNNLYDSVFTTDATCAYIRIAGSSDNFNPKVMLNTGSTPLPYEPYGYKIPISNGQQTIDIYIGDLPLLKSLDGTAVDEISNGTLTRRVDSDGRVLPSPTTTQITMPSIPTTEGANSITVDTTVQPSEFTATWTGWHDSSVKEWDGSQWG